MARVKCGKSPTGNLLHFSVGAIIVRDGKYLLVDRAVQPEGFACVAGHIEENELPETALLREIKEESNLDVTSFKQLVEEEVPWNWCSRGVKEHHWFIYECVTTGDPQVFLPEAKSIGWFTPEEIKKLALEPVWEYWLKKFGII